MSTVFISNQQPMRRPKKQNGFTLIERMTATAVIYRLVKGLIISMYLPIFLLGLGMQ